MPLDWFEPDWPAPPRVRALVTTRSGGVSGGPYASLNLGTRVGDNADAVRENRARLSAVLPSEPKWLEQVHGTDVVQAERAEAEPRADAVFTGSRDVVCAVQIADCLPVLLCNRAGTSVAAAHAGWRGLSAGVLERAVATLPAAPEDIIAWLGPAIGPQKFEVGRDVFAAFAGSEMEFDLHGLYDTFTADVGMDDSSRGEAAGEFSVIADGKELWHSDALKKGDPAVPVNISIHGVRKLILQTRNPGAKSARGQADWLEPTISKTAK